MITTPSFIEAPLTFQDVLHAVRGHLRRHGTEGIGDLRTWLLVVTRRVEHRHQERLYGPKERPQPTTVALDALLDGDAEYYLPPAPAVMAHDDSELEHRLLKAIHRLEGRHREFAERHFLRGQSPADIIRAMGLPNERSFKHLQRQTLKLLVELLKDALATTLASVASSWVA